MIGTVDDTFTLRVAVAADVPALNQLIAESATALSRGYYSAPQIAALVQFVFGVDTQLIRDGSYFVLESGRITGSGEGGDGALDEVRAAMAV